MSGHISQRLVPSEGVKGRIAAMEIMLNTPLIADLIFAGSLIDQRSWRSRTVWA